MRRILPLTLVSLILMTAASTPRAGGIDWSASIGLSAADHDYLSLSVSHFNSDHETALVAARGLADPGQDLPVLLFLARESGRPMPFILEMRLKGLSWWKIRGRLGVPPERVVVALARDPGPPYGKAHGTPAFASLMPPVSGLLAPTDMRPEVGAEVPERTPGANTNTLSGPSGSQVGSHSSSRIRADSARPPSIFQASGYGSVVAVWFNMSTRIRRSWAVSLIAFLLHDGTLL